MILDKKKISIIAGVSVAVLTLSLGLGLGLGLKSSSSDEFNEQYATVTGIAVSSDDINNGKTTIAGVEYQVSKTGDDVFIQVPSSTYTLSPSTIRTKGMFGSGAGKIYKGSTVMGEGKDNFYNLNGLLESLNVGVVKIPGDGKIYGGYVEKSDHSGYEINTKLASVFPSGYQIGDFNIEGKGGINMLMLEKYSALMSATQVTADNVDSIVDNAPTTTKFGLFLFQEGSKQVIRLATNNAPTKPSEIGMAPANPATVTSQWPGGWGDDDIKPTIDEHLAADYTFKIREFTNMDGSTKTLTLESTVTDLNNAVYDVPLNELYMPITLTQGNYVHPVLGLIQPRADGTVSFNDSITTESGAQPTVTINNNGTLTLPTLLIKLEKNVFNNVDYATATTRRRANELLISVESEWLDYFKSVANDQRVKGLAQQNGITIRFKIGPTDDERNYITNVGVRDLRAAEVFFMPADAAGNFNTRNQLAPLLENGILKNNLENPAYYDDGWRSTAKIMEGTDQGKYAFYPFNQETQIIAYNTDYLPNGLDFSNGKTVADYLYQENLGDLAAMETLATAPSDDQKNGLLVAGHLIIGGTVWAFDYYDEDKKDQLPNQQDIGWKKLTRGTGDTSDPDEKDYWSVFADPNLKDDVRFKKWVDHNRNSNPARVGNIADSAYDKTALFNGHIGAIMIGPWWVNTQWRNGDWRKSGSDAEKATFASDKIRFQTIPKSLASGWYGAMASVLKTNPNKQQVAEIFLNVLTDPNNAHEFNQGVAKIPARKDVDLSGINDPITASLFGAVANTPTVSRVGIGNWVWETFGGATAAIPNYNGNNLYEDIANDYRDKGNADGNVNHLFAPE